jgi:hypothetical protein
VVSGLLRKAMFDRVRDLLYMLCLPRVKNYGSFGTARKVVMQATRSSRPRAGCSVSLGTLMAATRQDLQTDDAYPWSHIQAVEICVSCMVCRIGLGHPSAFCSLGLGYTKTDRHHADRH